MLFKERSRSLNKPSDAVVLEVVRASWIYSLI